MTTATTQKEKITVIVIIASQVSRLPVRTVSRVAIFYTWYIVYRHIVLYV